MYFDSAGKRFGGFGVENMTQLPTVEPIGQHDAVRRGMFSQPLPKTVNGSPSRVCAATDNGNALGGDSSVRQLFHSHFVTRRQNTVDDQVRAVTLEQKDLLRRLLVNPLRCHIEHTISADYRDEICLFHWFIENQKRGRGAQQWPVKDKNADDQ